MNPHLPAESVSKWILAERTLAEEEHVRHCSACRAEVARVADALAQFRSAVRQAGDTPRLPLIEPAAPYGRRWALAALILIAASWPVYRAVTEHRRAEAARADAILLEQVDAGVSRTIARPMEPLAKWMAWDNKQNSEVIR
jgi:hypothetical protein